MAVWVSADCAKRDSFERRNSSARSDVAAAAVDDCDCDDGGGDGSPGDASAPGSGAGSAIGAAADSAGCEARWSTVFAAAAAVAAGVF